MDDQRLGSTARRLRIRMRLRQVDVAGRAGVAQSTVSRIERGHLESLATRTIRQVLAALDARLDLQVRWRGGEIDRLLDERHSALARVAAEELRWLGWSALAELSFSVYGERGSIDLVAYHEASRVAVVIEVKTSITSVEQLLRTTDAKLRLLPSLVSERLGWHPRTVARILVLEDGRTNRRRLAEHRSLLQAAFPGTTVATRRWLRSLGAGPPPGVWVLPGMHGRHRGRASDRPAKRGVCR